jgi:enamine deaminase RidA (YjgF/YER057c/UK114 family)
VRLNLTQRKNFSSETPWEKIVGYSRGVRIGNSVFISGTTSTDEDGNIVGISDPYKQTIQIVKKIELALHALDAHLEDIARIRVYVKNINDWEQIGQALLEFFKEIRPASTLVEVSRLINPQMLVEIDADAIVK